MNWLSIPQRDLSYLLDAKNPAFAMVAALLCFSLSSCAHAQTDIACGKRPGSEVRTAPPAFNDPSSQWRRFRRLSETYDTAIMSASETAVREAAWNICRGALALKPFTREVAADIRPRFSKALNTVVNDAGAAARGEEAPLATSPAVRSALTELSAAIPRFWLSPAASLRGSRQPGSPLWTHR